MKKLMVVLFAAFSLVSCDEDTVNQILAQFSRPTEGEATNGLKAALEVGAGAAVDVLNKQDGYFLDEAVKILLPEEAQTVIDAVEGSNNPLVTNAYNATLKPVVNDLILSLNRSAEDAAGKATPIFVDAITGMSISDAFNILQGGETAATDFLRAQTYDQLFAEFQPEISASLDKDLIGTSSTNDVYNTFTTKYNSVSALSFGSLPAIQDTDLGSFVTNKGLDGLFVKLAVEEKNIRENPLGYASDIIQNVFGWLQEQGQ